MAFGKKTMTRFVPIDGTAWVPPTPIQLLGVNSNRFSITVSNPGSIALALSAGPAANQFGAMIFIQSSTDFFQLHWDDVGDVITGEWWASYFGANAPVGILSEHILLPD